MVAAHGVADALWTFEQSSSSTHWLLRVRMWQERRRWSTTTKPQGGLIESPRTICSGNTINGDAVSQNWVKITNLYIDAVYVHVSTVNWNTSVSGVMYFGFLGHLWALSALVSGPGVFAWPRSPYTHSMRLIFNTTAVLNTIYVMVQQMTHEIVHPHAVHIAKAVYWHFLYKKQLQEAMNKNKEYSSFALK